MTMTQLCQCSKMSMAHTTYIRNSMGQECEGNCVLWIFNELIKKIYPEHLKKIVGAVCELPAKSTANPAQFEWKWAELAVL